MKTKKEILEEFSTTSDSDELTLKFRGKNLEEIEEEVLQKMNEHREKQVAELVKAMKNWRRNYAIKRRRPNSTRQK